ncbi:hypothetical protein [Sphingobium phenoxybenzoativorans]|uniref:hypothetical protein n=1 Tax=Sphingobium phenoxybenzoativorans TaxID=1592790 RepID=UPI001112D8F4|nr:hypothetical protein [Sphingobium phenoxybenzoativorans]
MRFAPYKIALVSAQPISRAASVAVPRPEYCAEDRITMIELVPVLPEAKISHFRSMQPEDASLSD